MSPNVDEEWWEGIVTKRIPPAYRPTVRALLREAVIKEREKKPVRYIQIFSSNAYACAPENSIEFVGDNFSPISTKLGTNKKNKKDTKYAKRPKTIS